MSSERGILPCSYSLPPPPPPQRPPQRLSRTNSHGRDRGSVGFGQNNLTNFWIMSSERGILPCNYSLPPPPPPPQRPPQRLSRTNSLGRNRGGVGFGQNNSEYEMTNQAGFAASQAAFAATTTLLYKNQHRQNDIDKHQSNNQNHGSNSNSSNTGLDQKNLKLLELYEMGLYDDEPYLKPLMDFKLDTPEAIAKWIEDRKRNYPTDTNIARKQQAEAERIARGLVIKVDKNGIKRKLKQEDDYSKRKISRHEIDKFGGPCGITDLVIAAEAAGTTLDLDNPTNFIPAYKPTYKNKKVASESTNIIEKFYSNICIKYRPGHCPRGKKCGNQHRGIMICPPLQRPPDHQRVRQRNLREMLLYKEKVQEKNAILQCLRYIADNNFFGVVTNDSLKNAKGPLIEVIDQDSLKKTL
ncbi:ccch zinc finger protein [Gigaspora margarita]|uniref:Ccch zinc finger protein n=1 Tax=Gigaspora margarita TaxID=4874 RepID=A0A8H3X7G4_GIGMA|nr:ccch zinc finger protein [Gigaspora margarita]